MIPERQEIFKNILNPLAREALVDLGAGHCKFTMIAHHMGFEVVAIDARDERVTGGARRYIAEPFFKKQDVRDVDLKPHAIVCILGLLYHLTLKDQCDLLAKCKDKTVIVDTNYVDKKAGGKLSNGYIGTLKEEVESNTSSFKNKYSFWHTEESLLKMFDNYGFFVMKILPEHHLRRSFYLLRPNCD